MKKTKRVLLGIMALALVLQCTVALAATQGSSNTSTNKNSSPMQVNKDGSGTQKTAGGTTLTYGPGQMATGSGSGGGGSKAKTVSKSWTTTSTTIDLTVTDITPLSGRQGLNLVSTISVKNTGTGYASSVPVEFEANGVTQTKYVNVAAGATVKVSFVWAAPNKEKVTITATVNKTKVVTESNYDNNTLSKDVTLKEGYAWANPEEAPETAVTIPSTPDGENNRTVTWEENGTSYSASLSLSVSYDPTGMKSGYGFKVTVNSAVTTNYPDNTVISQPQQVVMFVPEFGYNSVVTLVKDGSSWVLPVNSISKINENRWYVPVWWPDGKKYEAVITVYGAYTPGGELIASDKVSIMIDSNMYTDDSTNGMWAR